jgi:hypothetical protein
MPWIGFDTANGFMKNLRGMKPQRDGILKQDILAQIDTETY